MERKKKWADAKKMDFVTSYLQNQAEEALPKSRPQANVRTDGDAVAITVISFHKPNENLADYNNLVSSLQNNIFKDKANIETNDENNIRILTVTGKANDLVDGINIELISKYLQTKIEKFKESPSPSAVVTVKKSADNEHQFHVEIIGNNREPYSQITKKLHSDIIEMMEGIFDNKAKKTESDGMPPMDNVTITGAIDDIIKDIKRKDPELAAKLQGKKSGANL